MSSLLEQSYKGPLRVIIHTLTGETDEFTPDLIRNDCTLFDYLGHSCACIFTNVTTKLTVGIGINDWKIIRFLQEEQILEVKQISGKLLGYEPEGSDKFNDLYGYPDEIFYPFMSSN